MFEVEKLSSTREEVLELTRELYTEYPNRPPLPMNGKTVDWNKVPYSREYSFCEKIASLIVNVKYGTNF